MFNTKFKDVFNELNEHVETIFNKALLERLLNSFTTATKLKVYVTDTMGNVLMSSNKGDSCFCSLIKDSSIGIERCKGVYERAGRQATKWNEPYIFRCHAGLTAWVCPIIVNGTHVGNIVCGQILMWEPTKYLFLEISDLTNDLELEQDKLIEAVKQLEIVSTTQVQAASDMLFMTANYLAQGGTGLLDYQQKLRLISSWLWTENNKQKDNQQINDELDDHYVFRIQDQLVDEIKKGNLVESKELMDKLALRFFMQSKGQIEIMKALCIEFISYLARLSTEYGIHYEESFKFCMLKFKELNELDTIEKVLLWLLTVGNYYLELLLQKNFSENLTLINKVFNYIQNNYSRPTLTVKEIAGAVYVSPSYLSHIFKKEKGFSLSEYINKFRIQQAKLLLRRSEVTNAEIAKMVGFADRSYFCRIFKKITGLNPNSYRKMG